MALVQNYVKSVLKVVVAQICNNMGWHAIQSTPMDLLVDILHRYLEELGRTSHRYCEQFGRTEPNLDDVGLAFKDIGIPVGELEDFVNNVEPVPFVQDIAKIPLPRPSNFQFPKIGSREVQLRPEWIDEHLPLLNPEAEDEERVPSPAPPNDSFLRKLCSIENSELESSPFGIKRPLDITGSSGGTFKRPRLYVDDEGSPMREGVSVYMTLTGEISAVREGRNSEAKTPKFYDEGRPSCTPSPEPSVADNDCKKDIKKEAKKDDKSGKTKSKKDKSKILKKKAGKEKKNSKDGTKKTKEKNKDGKEKKLTVKFPVERGPDGKFKKVKSSSKIKLPKPKLATFKPFLTKTKSNKSSKLIVSSNKVAKVKKKLQKLERNMQLPPKFSKIKAARSTKSPQKHSSPLAQLASFFDKNPLGREKEKEKEKDDIGGGGGGFPHLPVEETRPPPSVKSELSEGFSEEDSPKPLVIDDNPEVAEKQEREGRMAALNDSIDSVIQKGLEETNKRHEEFSRSYHQTIEDVIRQGVESLIKNEPRDVYDFTDDDLSPPATPTTPDGLSVSPLKKKPRRESNDVVGKGVRDKIKEKIKLKKDAKSKVKSPKIPVKTEGVVDEGADSADERPHTPEVHPEHQASVSFQAPFPRMLNQFPLMPYFGQISQVPPALLPYPPPTIPPLPVQFQSHTPPNMPMPPMGFYVRNPRPETGNLRFSDPCHLNNPPPPPYLPVEPEREVEVEKVKMEVVDDVEKGKVKEHKKEKKEKVAKDVGVVGDTPDGEDKSKNKKRKEKTKKEKKTTDVVDGEKLQTKSKNKEKAPKTKEKSKKTVKEKKKDKVKEDLSGSGIPKITFKLGNNSSSSEGTKIVIKSMTSREKTQSCDIVSSPVPDLPIVVAKSHPKPQSKVNPVPLPVKLATPAVTVAATPANSATTPSSTARTVITETVGTIIDDQGNKIWICPACTRPDDGSPMIGCDECDDWYHWVCVGIVVPPKEEENWFCSRCIVKKQGVQKKKRKKHRKDKIQL